jgi:hypothetical protein
MKGAPYFMGPRAEKNQMVRVFVLGGRMGIVDG